MGKGDKMNTDISENELVKKITEERFDWEDNCLGDFAFHSKFASRKSDKDGECAGQIPDLRNPFAHDTDRIIHTHAYARYMDKTQVFFQIKNDHITRRSLHVQMVSRIARTIGRCLCLNEDLIEAIAIGHDIGHTPFGHAGEAAISRILKKLGAGVFVHNAQSVRVLQELEHKGKGCDLTLEVLDGIIGHNGEFTQPLLKYNHKNLSWEKLEENMRRCLEKEEFDKEVFPSTMEGCVVRVSDVISYLGKDFEDAVNLRMMKSDSLPLDVRRVLGSTNREIVNTLCSDVIKNSYGKGVVAFSEEKYEALDKLKKYNYANIYGCEFISEQRRRFEMMVEMLFECYLEDLSKADASRSIFTDYLSRFPDSYLSSTPNERIVADFIAGMTDQYFLNQYAARFLPGKIDYDQIALLNKVQGTVK